MSQGPLIPVRRRSRRRRPPLWLPPHLRPLWRELDERSRRLPTRLNEYGFDPFGFDPEFGRTAMLVMALVHRYWFRVETEGLERVPLGRVLLVANHAGNTFAWDGAMLAMSLFLEGEPPRIVRGMGEYYLPKIPFFSTMMLRFGSVVGTPANCVHLLHNEEAVMVFPEGERGFVKPYRKRYQLQRFGLGFMRLALETKTPVVPVGIAGAEEQSPGLARVRSLGRLVGAPVVPITITMPWLGPLGFLPLPVKFRICFGEPLRFEGDPDEEDARIQPRVDRVKQAIRVLMAEARAGRSSWFF